MRRWLPELARVPARYVHEPWRMPAGAQDEAGVRIGRQYPAPIVDQAQGRQRALVAYREARRRPSP